VSKIILHTPRFMRDDKTTTEFEATDIIQIKSVAGDDDNGGSHFWVRGIAERQHCLESANDLRKLVEKHKNDPQQPITMGDVHIGDVFKQNGINFFWKDVRFQTGLAVGFFLGIITSYIAAWLWSIS